MHNLSYLPFDLFQPISKNQTWETRQHFLQEYGIKVLITDFRLFSFFGDSKQDTEKLLQHFQSEEKMPHLLLYCIPVHPSSNFNDDNPDIMRTLQDCFGKKVWWKHCKLIFTFSNVVWDRLQSASDPFLKYKAQLNKCASLFEAGLRELGVDDVIVRTTFAEDQTTKEGQSKIVALPAGDDEDDEVFAGISSSHRVGDKIDIKWKDPIFIQIAKSCNGQSCTGTKEHTLHQPHTVTKH